MKKFFYSDSTLLYGISEGDACEGEIEISPEDLADWQKVSAAFWAWQKRLAEWEVIPPSE